MSVAVQQGLLVEDISNNSSVYNLETILFDKFVKVEVKEIVGQISDMKGRKVRFVRLVLALSRIRSRSVDTVGVRHQSVNSLKSVDQSGLQKHLLDIW